MCIYIFVYACMKFLFELALINVGYAHITVQLCTYHIAKLHRIAPLQHIEVTTHAQPVKYSTYIKAKFEKVPGHNFFKLSLKIHT